MAKKVSFCSLYELCPFQFKALLTVADVEYNFHISWQMYLYWNYEYYECEVFIHLTA